MEQTKALSPFIFVLISSISASQFFKFPKASSKTFFALSFPTQAYGAASNHIVLSV